MNNTRQDFIESVQNKRIICFGAGKFFYNVKGFLDSENLKIWKLVDNDKEKWGKKIDGLEVLQPKKLLNFEKHSYVVLISSRNFAKEIEMQIEQLIGDDVEIYRYPLSMNKIVDFNNKLWYERIYKTCENLYREISKRMDTQSDAEDYLREKICKLQDKERLVLPRTPIMITTRCTLNCKECSNLMPYYKKRIDYSSAEIMKWMQNIVDVVDEWVCCEFVGGEPFLYKDLDILLNFALNERKIQRIELTTNGSIIPSQDVLTLLSNRKVHVKVSEYPKLVDCKKVVDAFQKYKVHYEIHKDLMWVKTGNLRKRNRIQEKLTTQYLNCFSSKKCRTILNGKLYVCSKAASLRELGYANEIEYVNLCNNKNLKYELSEFLKLTVSNACDYCDIGSEEEEIIEAAIQFKPDNDEINK